jgi:hypothetical protein
VESLLSVNKYYRLPDRPVFDPGNEQTACSDRQGNRQPYSLQSVASPWHDQPIVAALHL